jgi:hypothetical protein
MERRVFLEGLSIGTVAAFLPNVAEAGELVVERVRMLRAQWARHQEDYLAASFPDHLYPKDTELARAHQVLGSSLGAFSVLKDLEQIPVEDQTHPLMQGFIKEVADAVGRSAVVCRELLEGFLASSEPDKELHLRGILKTIRIGAGDWKTTEGRQRGIELSVEELERESPEGLKKRAEREVRKIRKAEALAEKLMQEKSGLVEIQDPAIQAKIRAGQARWGTEATDELPLPSESLPLPETPPEDRTRRRLYLVLGIILISAGSYIGVVIVILAACAAACGGSPVAAIMVFLLGISIIGLSVWFGIALIRKQNEPRKLESEASLFGPRQIVAEKQFLLMGNDGWIETPFERNNASLLLVQASGLVRQLGAWFADADGSGMLSSNPSVLVPGAPLGALVGKVGKEVFFIGREAMLPDGEPGRLLLAINRDEKVALGQLVVRVSVLEPVAKT